MYHSELKGVELSPLDPLNLHIVKKNALNSKQFMLMTNFRNFYSQREPVKIFFLNSKLLIKLFI